jgi:hypothetical protein
MRVLVCGGRDFDDTALMEAELNMVTNPHHGGKWSFELISGCARGADTLAILWADRHGIVVHHYPADWKKYGKAAGPIRNKQMLEEGKPDIVIAFPGGKGTANMVKLAREAGVKVIEVPERVPPQEVRDNGGTVQ